MWHENLYFLTKFLHFLPRIFLLLYQFFFAIFNLIFSIFKPKFVLFYQKFCIFYTKILAFLNQNGCIFYQIFFVFFDTKMFAFLTTFFGILSHQNYPIVCIMKKIYIALGDCRHSGTHQFDLFCTSTHRLYFDQNFTPTCTSRPIRSPDLPNGRSTEKVELMRTPTFSHIFIFYRLQSQFASFRRTDKKLQKCIGSFSRVQLQVLTQALHHGTHWGTFSIASSIRIFFSSCN